MVHVTGITDNLAFAGFSGKASSAIVLSGTWLVYNGPTLTGDSIELPRGNFPDGFGDILADSLAPIFFE